MGYQLHTYRMRMGRYDRLGETETMRQAMSLAMTLSREREVEIIITRGDGTVVAIYSAAGVASTALGAKKQAEAG